MLSKAVVFRLFYLQASNKHNPLMVYTVYLEYWEPANNDEFEIDLYSSQVYENYTLHTASILVKDDAKLG